MVVLRQWRESDFEPFASMNADPEVMRYFPQPLTRDESRAAFERFQQGIKETGWGLWAVEVAGNFAGFTGLAVPKFAAHFTPCVEIGWRLRREYWGQGIAFGAACQATAYAFEVLCLEELVSFTAATNERSRRLMERLQFQHDSRDDFNHPKLDENHPLSHHVLYRRKRKGQGVQSV